ncbi:hypothetical protein C464_08155 [Halorubrum coriense DSM 10284]|uniref:Methyltransferase n=1 Tax=Halorubrum coriense DSM 10284 TaxID=1227466 RepID=M0ENA0_9EURY|nr:hypothetical protein C464_08155 [Halorubrum coriense DSM 10284]
MDTRDIPSVHEYTDAWQWPESVERFIREQLPRDEDARVLNVPAGSSRLGDVLVDAEPQSEDIEEGDMMDLDLPPAEFDAVISDPPWRGMDYFDRWKQFYQLCRVTKPGGLIVYNAPWEPASDQCEVVSRHRRADHPFGEISQITVFRRYPGQQTWADFD